MKYPPRALALAALLAGFQSNAHAVVATDTFTTTPSPTNTETPGGNGNTGPLQLLSACNYAILAGTGITNSGNSSVTGDLGSYPTNTQNGFGTLTLTGTNQGGNTITQGAKLDLTNAYNDGAGRAANLALSELGSTVKPAGVYTSADGTFQITGILTLDGGGDPNAVFIFQMATTLTTAGASSVVLINQAQAKNVFWIVGSSATLGGSSTLSGSILAYTAISLDTGASVDGRTLAQNGAVSLLASTISMTSVCSSTTGTLSPTFGASFSPTPSSTPTGTDVGSTTGTPSSTFGASFSPTPSSTPTGTDVGSTTGTPSPTFGASFSPTPSSTSTITGGGTLTSTSTITAIVTATSTATVTPSNTPGNSATVTVTPVATNDPTPVPSTKSYIYPSPARGEKASIAYNLRENGEVVLKIHGQTGRLVSTIREMKTMGWQSSQVSTGSMATGTYYYVLSVHYASGATETQAANKFVVLH